MRGALLCLGMLSVVDALVASDSSALCDDDEDTWSTLSNEKDAESVVSEAGEEHMLKNEVESSLAEEGEMEDETLNTGKWAKCSLDGLHTKARAPNKRYEDMGGTRVSVNDAEVGRPMVGDPLYSPTEFTAQSIIDNDITVKVGGYADPMDPNAINEVYIANKQPKLTKFNAGTRKSYMGKYKLNEGKPLNPCGRTGMSGRGGLGKWGPNYAADPIVTRNAVTNGQQAVQILLIKRGDTGEWAIPGGMVDYGEAASASAKREFTEEAGAFPEGSPEQKEFQGLVDVLFNTGTKVYEGYVDDPRNTDNAWMETAAFRFHCSDELAGKLKTKAGDDAQLTMWANYDPEKEQFTNPADPERKIIKLYASHSGLIKAAFRKQKTIREKVSDKLSRVYRRVKGTS